MTDPEILEYRADKRGEAREYFPRGVFQLLLSDQKKIDFTDRECRALPDPLELSLSFQRSGRLLLREKAVLQNELRSMPHLAWLITLCGLFIYILYRYLCVIPEKHKKFLSFDCGFLTGGLLMILAVFLPLKWGYRASYSGNFSLVLFICSFYCGMFTAWKMRGIAKWQDLFFSLLACLPLSLFFVSFQENLYNGFPGGVSGGLACGFFVQKYALCRREYFLGLGSALLLGTIGIFLSCVWQYAFLLAVSALEYVKKAFEKN